MFSERSHGGEAVAIELTEEEIAHQRAEAGALRAFNHGSNRVLAQLGDRILALDRVAHRFRGGAENDRRHRSFDQPGHAVILAVADGALDFALPGARDHVGRPDLELVQQTQRGIDR
jgi:hypothetical protein